MMNMKSVTCAAFAVLALAVEAQGKIWEWLSPQEFWAGRKRHPAVVHSVTAVKDGSIVSLAGEWQILMREHHLGYPHYMGAKDAQFEKDGRGIRVPGTWEAQGIGEKTEPKPHLCIDYSPKPLRNVHLGHGHYRRSVRISADWKGRRIWLKGPRSAWSIAGTGPGVTAHVVVESEDRTIWYNMRMSENTAVYPGTFDPMTLGHFDLICRSAKLYDRLVVAVAATSKKQGALFNARDRLAMIREDVRRAGLDNVEVKLLDCLLVDFCRREKAHVVIRGVRVYSDFEYEFQMALTNRRMAPEIETLFMMPSENLAYVTASTVREIASYGGDTSSFVTPAVQKRLAKKEKSRS